VLDGVLQATGAVLLVIGAASSDSEEPQPERTRVVAMPSRVGQSGYGLGVLGTF
jgi:hypothetical protein